MIELLSAGFDDRDPRWRKPLSRTTSHAMALVVTGKLYYRIDGETLHAKKGDLLFIPEGCMREAFHDHSDHHRKYWVTFAGATAGRPPIPLLDRRTPFLTRTRHYEYMKQRFSMLLQQWMGKLPHYEIICSAIVAELLGHVHRELDAQHHPSPKLDVVASIQRYILEHYREPIRVDALARHVGLTPNYVSSLFRQLTGSTVKEYVHQVKLSAARDLLLTTDITVGEAAEYVGFCDPSYFHRVFKKLHGFPPSALRQERPLLPPEPPG